MGTIMQMQLNTDSTHTDYFRFVLDDKLNFSAYIDSIIVFVFFTLIVILIISRFITFRKSIFSWVGELEIDEAELGIGNQKLKLRPNSTDRQIAYKIWVELSTRKIGLQIDLKDDIITEVYNSWYSFFSITRELVKDVPVSRFSRKDTSAIVTLSIDVLNEGVRPHLTKWQARYWHWHKQEMEKLESAVLEPQAIQQKYPEYQELSSDLLKVNKHLIRYREKMHELIGK